MLNFSNIGKFLITRCAFVEVNLVADGIICNVLVVRTKKNQLIINESFEKVDSISLLIEKLPKKIPVQFVVTGYGIISKIVETNQQIDISKEKYLLDNFPNINQEDVYFSIYASGSKSIISVLRKTKLDQIISEIDKRIHLIKICIGEPIIASIKSFLEESSCKLIFRNLEYNFENSELLEITRTSEKTQEIFQIGNEELNPNTLLPYALVLNQFDSTLNNTQDNSLDQLNNFSFEEFVFGRILGFLWKAALVSILFLLMVNYIVFNHLSNVNSGLIQKISVSETTSRDFVENKQSSNKLKRTLLEYGFLNDLCYSSRINQLSNLLENDMAFTSIEFHPLKKEKNKDISKFQQNTILVNGNTENNLSLNNYVRTVSDLTWISQIKILNVEKNEMSGKLLFKIAITSLEQ